MLELKQTRSLRNSFTDPQLQQAIKLLQLSQMELLEAIEQEIKETFLEMEEESASRRRSRRRKRSPSGWKDSLLQRLCR